MTPERTAIIDRHGAETFATLNARAGALAGALAARGVGAADTIAVQAANDRWLVEIQIAAARLGASTLLLPADLREESLHTIVGKHEASVLIEGARSAHVSRGPRALVAAPPRDHSRGEAECLESLIAEGLSPPRPDSAVRASYTLVHEDERGSCTELSRPATLTSPSLAHCAFPLRNRESTVMCAPPSSPWGQLHLLLAMRRSATLVLADPFEPIDALALLEHHAASSAVMLPEQLAEIIALPDRTLRWYRTPALRVIAVQGRTLPGRLAIPALTHFGPVLYNRAGPSVISLQSFSLTLARSG